MRFEVLGPVTVVSNDGYIHLRPASRKLLACMLLSPNKPIPVSTLVERMWGESPPTAARNALQAHVSRLRGEIGSAIHTAGDHYIFELNGHEFDILEFTAAADEAASLLDDGKFDQARERAAHAVKLWRGDPFPEIVDVLDARGVIEHLTEKLVSTKIALARAMSASGRGSDALAVLKPLTEEHSLNEAIWEGLILAYYLAGRQADALRAFQDAARVLGEELGIDPGPRLKDLEERILLQAPDLTDGIGRRAAHNLPLVESSFVGREADVGALVELVKAHHLVTLVGAPGAGKTRLAVETASRMATEFPVGVWLARLAGAASREDVLVTVAAATGVTEQVDDLGHLARILAPRPALLVLDNCEHVARDVVHFLEHQLLGDQLRVLATSRSRLGTANEILWPLQPLDVPSSIADMWESSTLQLLADRVQAADPSIDLDRFDAEELVQVCLKTAGMPLAIELTARWLPALDLASASRMMFVSPPEPVSGLEPHHASVATAIAWSVALLDPEDQKAFDAAAAFAAPFTIDAFANVCTPRTNRSPASETIARLVEASLLIPERSPDGAVRYRMLEPLRQFADARLTRRQARAVADRHAQWFVGAAQAIAESVFTATEPASYAEVDVTIADYRQAMRHLLDSGQPSKATDIAVSFRHYWISRFLAGEGRRWLRECLDLEPDRRQAMRILDADGEIAFYAGEYDLSAARFAELREAAVAARERRWEAEALHGLGLVESYKHRERGTAFHLDAAKIFEEVSDRVMAAKCRMYVGMHLAFAGELVQGSDLLEQALTVCEEEGAHRIASFCHRYLAVVSWIEDDEQQARGHLEEAERLALESNDRRVISGTGQVKALIEGRWGDPAIAASAVIDMANAVSSQHGIYFSMMTYAAMPLLMSRKEWDLAARLFNHADQVYQQYGWAPLDEQNVIARSYRAAVSAHVTTHGLTPDLGLVSTATIANELVARLTEIRPASSGLAR